MRPAVTVPALLGALLLAGCAAGPARVQCVEQPARASLDFPWAEDEAALMDALRVEGWTVTKREHALGFDVARGGVRGGGSHFPPLHGERARLDLLGLLGSHTEEEAREDLAHVAEPLAARFGANVTYEAGWRVCS